MVVARGWRREKNFVSMVDFMLIAFYHIKITKYM